MDLDRFIQTAIKKGEQSGGRMLDPLRRTIFLLSELEVYCDKDGIDSFLDRYGAVELRAVADMLRDAGAAETADSLCRLADALPQHDERLLNSANDLVSNRTGYDYDAIARVVASRLPDDCQ
jgi:hypothetical protein